MSYIDKALCDLAAAIPVGLLGVPGWSCVDSKAFPEVCNSSSSSWYGVRCSALGDIIAIDLEYLFLPGSLPSSIGSFSKLQFLSIAYNYLSGSIPSEIGILTNLVDFDIGWNSIGGKIPSSIGMLSKLQTFYAYANHLTGPIPPTIGMMTAMEAFWILFNHMTGTIPSSIGYLTNMLFAELELNHFSGTIPTTIRFLTKSIHFNVFENSLTGTIPSSIGLLSNLDGVDLFFNSLTGTIPSSLGLLTNSLQLNLFNNLFSGTIPSTVCLMNGLQYLNIFNNTLTGTIPTCVGLLTNLQEFSVDFNSLRGTVPSTIGCLRNLTLLAIQDNKLTGTLPWELGNITTLQVFGLSNNYLHGTLPSSLQYISELTTLVVSANSFSGTIPSFIWYLSHLKWLDFGENSFVGTISPKLGNLISLEGLLLNSNRLTSTVPPSIQNLSNLQYLMVHKNRLTGSVPSLNKLSNLVWVLLNDNSFSGSLHDISINSSFLQLCDMSNNRFTGTIPSLAFQYPNLIAYAAAGNCLLRYLPEDICRARGLRVLALDGLQSSPHCTDPFVHGVTSKSYVLYAYTKHSIPACIYNMPHLEILHLSGNAFSGTLPSNIELTATFVDLTLSHNILSGTIPSAIQAKSWSRLDLSYNKLSGTLENTVGLGNSSLALVVNRLSGTTPAVLSSARHVDVLRGNVFECKFDTSVLPKHDALSHTYTCGSDAMEISFFVYLCSLGMASLAVVVLYLIKSATFFRLVVFVRDLLNGPQNTLTDLVLNRVRHICVATTCLIMVTLLPTYSVLGMHYANHHYRYGWIVSGAYLSGNIAAIVLLMIWSGLILYFTYSMTRVFHMLQTKEFEVPIGNDVSEMTQSQRIAHVVLVGILGIFDFAVIFLSNCLYIAVATLFGYKDAVLLQILAGGLKLVWNLLFVQNIHSITQYLLGIERCSSLVFDTVAIVAIILINNVIIPFMAEAVIDPHCFYNVLFTPDPVSISYTIYGLCIAPFTNYAGTYCSHPSVQLSTTYIPPFIYTYECSSALLVNYVTVFVYLYLSLSFLSPLGIMLILFFRHPRRQSPEESNGSMLHVSVINYWTILLSCCVMLMTFGVLYPPLAVVICLCVIINSLLMQYLVREGLVVFDGDIPNTGQSSLLLLLVIIGVFHAWFLFDIAGDEVGGTIAIWAPVAAIIIPLGLWLFIMIVVPPSNSFSTFPMAHSMTRIHVC